MRKCMYAALLVVAAFVLAACGGGDAPGDEDPGADNGNGTVDVDVAMIDIDFEPDSVSVPSGSTLVVNLTNDGAIEHNFTLEDGSGSSMVAPGDSETVELGPLTESTTAWCTVPGHREAGMEFDINVD